MSCKAYFDGSCYRNYCGIGYVIRDPKGVPVWTASEYVGRGDALCAEYQALMALLKRLQALEIEEAVIHGDSRTVIGQVNGEMNTRATNRFRHIIRRMQRFLDENPRWQLQWIPRGQNAYADALAAEGLSEVRVGRKGAAKTRLPN